MKVLIAEDEPMLQEMASDLMDFWGYDFDIAPNGQEAVNLAKIKEGKYDICLMDIDMPVMNGCEATKEIRKRIKYFPIMAVSGNEEIRNIYSNIGMDDFLEKPYSIDTLYDKINELTVKVEKIYLEEDKIYLKKEMPMDQKHGKELRELAKEGLCKMSLKGTGAHDVTFIVHKNVPFSISHDFIETQAEVTTFIDHSKDHPAECYVYKSSCLVPAIYLTDEEYSEKKQQESEKLKSRNRLITEKKK